MRLVYDDFNRCERVQPCGCDADQLPWNRYDYNAFAELCHGCAAEMVRSGHPPPTTPSPLATERGGRPSAFGKPRGLGVLETRVGSRGFQGAEAAERLGSKKRLVLAYFYRGASLAWCVTR
jgi:hypothetical protein